MNAAATKKQYSNKHSSQGPFELTTNGGVWLFQAGCQADADGSPQAKRVDPQHGQLQTSLWHAGKSIDALAVNYFVMPTNWVRCTTPVLARPFRAAPYT
jgi:hypothetical protein